jgi:Transglutaminase-like superfamily
VTGRLHGALWAAWALIVTRRQLHAGGIDTVRVPKPRDLSDAAASGATAVLLRSRASCLTQSLVRQAWFAARGLEREVVIGVSRREGFAAHAWLEGDPVNDAGGYVELLRR